MISKPYLLFLGEAKDDLAIKTASGVRFWRPEWCVGQIYYKDANAKLDLPTMNIKEAVANGCKTMVIGVVNAGGVMPESWIDTILEASRIVSIHDSGITPPAFTTPMTIVLQPFATASFIFIVGRSSFAFASL